MPVAVDDLHRPWRLSDQVSLRDESFGALAYHHRTRRLVFLKSPELVALVRALEHHDTAFGALAATVPDDQRDRYAAALSSLARSAMLDVG